MLYSIKKLVLIFFFHLLKFYICNRTAKILLNKGTFESTICFKLANFVDFSSLYCTTYLDLQGRFRLICSRSICLVTGNPCKAITAQCQLALLRSRPVELPVKISGIHSRGSPSPYINGLIFHHRWHYSFSQSVDLLCSSGALLFLWTIEAIDEALLPPSLHSLLPPPPLPAAEGAARQDMPALSLRLAAFALDRFQRQIMVLYCCVCRH